MIHRNQYPNPKRSSAQSEQGRDKARRGKSEAAGIRSAGPAGTAVKVAEASQGVFTEPGRDLRQSEPTRCSRSAEGAVRALYDPVPDMPTVPQWWRERRAQPQPDPRDDELRDRGTQLLYDAGVKRLEARGPRRLL